MDKRTRLFLTWLAIVILLTSLACTIAVSAGLVALLPVPLGRNKALGQRSNIIGAILSYRKAHGLWPRTWSEAATMDMRYQKIPAQITLLSESLKKARYRIELHGTVMENVVNVK